MKSFAWNMNLRMGLEKMLKEGFPISHISQELGITKATIYEEVKKGVTEQEYRNRQYSKYLAKKSIDYQAETFKRKLIEGRDYKQ